MATKAKLDAEIVNVFNTSQDSLVLQASDMSLETVAAMVEKGAIDTQPAYQRRERWSQARQSALIESFILNIPIPPVYLAEEAYGKYTVIDGKQRLSTIRRFMRNELQLVDLEKFVKIDGYVFSGLPTELRNALEIRPYVRVVTLLKQSDPELKYEVFQRLNTGGEALYAQEIRNAAFRGPLNDVLINLSNLDFLRQQLKITKNTEPAYLQMQDVEYVLRFFMMHSTWRNFSGDYRRSMDEYMEANRNPGEAKLKSLRKLFTESIQRCENLWGDEAFKRFGPDGVRNQFLAGMYDAQMVAVSLLTAQQTAKLVSKPQKVVAATQKLFADTDFESWVRYGTNTKSSVEKRITSVHEMLVDLA